MYLWKVSSDIKNNKTFINFSAWAFVTHALTLNIIGYMDKAIMIHMFNDSLWWWVMGALLFLVARSKPEEASHSEN